MDNNIYENKNTFFAAANTHDGFVSYFDKIFDNEDADTLYILKGGPGVGKSTFMKKLASLSESKGCSVEYFLCSSDPSSLDGIIIKDKKIAVVDGTNPHAVEPKLAGAREIIVDLGRSWDIAKLHNCKEEISNLSKQKSKCYDQCYRLLNCKKTIDDLNFNLVSPYILTQKLDKSINRLLKGLFRKAKKDTSKIKIRITNAVSALGKVSLDTFESMADNVIYLKEPYPDSRVPNMYMKKVFDCAKNMGTEIYVSYSPMQKGNIDALYFPKIRTCICLYNEEHLLKRDKTAKKARVVGTKVFIDEKGFSHLKPLRKFYSRLSENLLDNALKCLKNAGELHAKLEKIYSRCTDYNMVESISEDYFSFILKD